MRTKHESLDKNKNLAQHLSNCYPILEAELLAMGASKADIVRILQDVFHLLPENIKPCQSIETQTLIDACKKQYMHTLLQQNMQAKRTNLGFSTFATMGDDEQKVLVGKVLKQLRLRHAYSQEQVLQKSGINVKRHEAGLCLPNFGGFLKLLHALQSDFVEFSALLEGELRLRLETPND